MRKLTSNRIFSLILAATVALTILFAGAASAHVISGIVDQFGAEYVGASFRLYDITVPSAIGTAETIYAGGYTIATHVTNSDLDNLAPAHNAGDTVVIILDHEIDGGTVDHVGYYTVNNGTLNGTPQEITWNDVYAIPRPTAILNASGTIELSWTAAIDDGSGNILGYNLYRGTDGRNFTQVNSSLITDVTATDTTVVAGNTYFYALSVVFIGTTTTPEIESLYVSANSNPATVGTPGVSIISVWPYWSFQNNTLDTAIIGENTNFQDGVTTVDFEGLNSISVNLVTWFTATDIVSNNTVGPTAQLGPRNVVAQTGAEVAVGPNMFWVVTSEVTFEVVPDQTMRGTTLDIDMIGVNTNFDAATSLAYFGPGVVVNSLTVYSPISAVANITVSTEAIIGPRVVIMYSGSEVAIAPFEITDGMILDDGIIANYPNPFDPQVEVTNMVFDLDSDTTVGIYIYDITARQVWKHVEFLPAGQQLIQWDGYTYYNKIADNGMYLVRAIDNKSKKFIGKGKIMVMKR